MFYAPFRFLQPTYPLCQDSLLHIRYISAVQIMHESPQFCILVLLAGIHIDKVRLIAELLACFFNNPINMQDRKV